MNQISWQRGYYESGRSKTHYTQDGEKTLCGLIIPASSDAEILGGNDGNGECLKCEKSLPSDYDPYVPISTGVQRFNYTSPRI